MALAGATNTHQSLTHHAKVAQSGLRVLYVRAVTVAIGGRF